MVSLRQRSSRPSYAALPEGFEGLSDEDGTASAGTNEGDAGPAHDSAVDPALRALQSEGNMPSSSAATSDGGMDDDMGDSESMSSGSDAYAPEADDGRKRRKVKLSKKASTTSIGKGKAGKGFSQGSGAGKGKGKGKASQQFELSDTDSDGDAFVPPDEASSGDGDGDADEGDPEDESEDMDMDADLDQEDDDVLLTIDTKPRRIPGTVDPSLPFAPPKKKNGGHLPRPAAMSAAAAASEDRAGLVDIPPAYRAAMESMADRMVNSSGGGVKEELDAEEEADVAPPATEKRNGKSHSKATRPVLSFLPRGTPLPWSSLLRATKPGESSTSNKKGKGKAAAPGPSAGGQGEEVVFRVGEGRLDRKWRNGRLAISCVLGTPRSGWEGEGWYPEMYDASAAVASGTEQDAGQEVAYEDLDIDPRTGQMSLPQKKKGRRPGSSKVEMAAAAEAPLRMSAVKGSTAGKGAGVKGKKAKVVDDDEEYDGEEGIGVTAASREALFGREQRGTLQDRPPAGWMLRGDVRLGLDGVGRLKAGEVRLLSADDADSYLPTTIDDFGNTSHTIHLGPFGHQEVVQMSLFDSFANEQYSHVDKGWTFHAGGPVWGLDWCPLPPTQISELQGRKYLAVSTLPHIETSTALGEKWPSDTKGSIQIWSIPPIVSDPGDAEDDTSAGEGAICEMVLCVQGAPVTSCKWMPLGAWDDNNDKTGNGLPKMGIIAALQLDGSISLHPVPHSSAIKRARRSASDLEDEQPLFLELPTPLLRIEITDASPTCMEWFTGSKLAVGYNDGRLAIWNVLPNLLDPSIPLLPDTYVQVADAAITALSVGRMPPKDGQNRFIFDADPVYVCCTSYDLTTRVVDMREPQHPYELGRTRLAALAVGFSQHNTSPIHADIDYVINMQKIKEDGPAKTLSLAVHRGPVWDVGTSDYHTMVVTASSDGSAILCSARMGANRVKTPAARQYFLMFQRLMEMDYDQHTGHYRLLDSFAPESQTSEQAVSRRVNSGPDRADVTVIKTANWDPRVAVHRVAWNDGCGIANAGLLALGTAMGLVRVQEMQPEWYRGNEEFVQRFPA